MMIKYLLALVISILVVGAAGVFLATQLLATEPAPATAADQAVVSAQATAADQAVVSAQAIAAEQAAVSAQATDPDGSTWHEMKL